MFKKFYTLIFLVPFLLAFQCEDDDPAFLSGETVFDIDGNLYNTIVIGNQTWMLENLQTTKYNDGSPITEYTLAAFGNDWGNLTGQEGLYQWADTSDLNNVVDEELTFDAYGAMYNHWAIESGKLAPEGYRVPTQADFEELENYLSNNGYNGNEATTLKSATGWLTSTGNGTDEVGFNGLPNGYINAFGGPTLGQGICTWATTNTSSGNRVLVQLFDQNQILYSENAIQIGAGIRCIKN
jgi:uncharacterized protein (TIGR02145 family)